MQLEVVIADQHRQLVLWGGQEAGQGGENRRVGRENRLNAQGGNRIAVLVIVKRGQAHLKQLESVTGENQFSGRTIAHVVVEKLNQRRVVHEIIEPVARTHVEVAEHDAAALRGDLLGADGRGLVGRRAKGDLALPQEDPAERERAHGHPADEGKGAAQARHAVPVVSPARRVRHQRKPQSWLGLAARFVRRHC